MVRFHTIIVLLVILNSGCGDRGDSYPDSAVDSGSVEEKRPLAWSLFITDEDWETLHLDPFADVEVPATLELDGKRYEAGVEIQGSSARKYPKKSYKMKFKGDGFTGNPFGDQGCDDTFETIIFKAMYKDQSLIREAIAWDIWRLMGLQAPRIGLATLCVNGRYWGLYAVVERVDEGYLNRNGYPPGGSLYKAVRKHGGYADFKPGRDLHKAFEKKTNVDEPWDDLEDLVDMMQNTPLTADAFWSGIDPIFSFDMYFKRMIWTSFTQNTDALAQNFFLYNSPTDAGPMWHLIPWDSDVCISNHWSLGVDVMPPDEWPMLDGGTYFSQRLVSIESIRKQYVEKFESMLSNEFSGERIDAILEYYFDLAREELARDLEHWDRSSTVEEEFAEITEFFEKRPVLLKKLLEEF